MRSIAVRLVVRLPAAAQGDAVAYLILLTISREVNGVVRTHPIENDLAWLLSILMCCHICEGNVVLIVSLPLVLVLASEFEFFGMETVRVGP